jgi:hypothetical protein
MGSVSNGLDKAEPMGIANLHVFHPPVRKIGNADFYSIAFIVNYKIYLSFTLF